MDATNNPDSDEADMAQIIAEDQAELEKIITEHKDEDYESYWTGSSRSRLAEAEAKVFKSVVQAAFEQRLCGGLGTVVIGRHQDAPDKPAMVLVHGFGMCNAAWLLIVDDLSRHFRVFLVELPGHGRSDRAIFDDESPDAVERILAAYLEMWRKDIALEEPFILVGHSLGAMVSWRYCADNPTRVSHLIMLSPVGLPDPPKTLQPAKWMRPWLFKLLMSKWESGWTPMDLVRGTGPVSHAFVSKVMRRRLGRYLPESPIHSVDVALLTDLMHQCWSLPRSAGESAMNRMLSPGAFARLPLIARVNGASPHVPPTSLPISIIYGDARDWMRPQFGPILMTALRDRPNQKAHVTCRTVESCAHMMSYDNPAGLLRAMLEELHVTEPESTAPPTDLTTRNVAHE